MKSKIKNDHHICQKVAYESYLSRRRNSDILSLCQRGKDGRFKQNTIRFGSTDYECPTEWEEGRLTAIQIAEGKTKPRAMRSQKLVLVRVEDGSRAWFEVAGLRKDLTYPFDSQLIGVRVFPFNTYGEAKSQFISIVNQAKRLTLSEETTSSITKTK